MQSKANTVAAYLKELPEDRRRAVQTVRKAILSHLPKGYEEGMQYGMIGYYVPHSIYPPGYHCDPKQPLPFVGLASQKNHMSVYLMGNYSDRAFHKWFVDEWARSGKKLDMGKCCVRFKRVEDVALETLGQAVKRLPVKKFIELYESQIPAAKRPKSASSKSAKPKTAKKKATKKRPVKKTKKRTPTRKA